MPDKKPVEEVKEVLTGESGYGADFLPTETANEIIEIVRNLNFIKDSFETISMKTEKMEIPRILTDIEFHGRAKEDGETPEVAQRYATDHVLLELKTVIASVGIGNKQVAYGIEALMPIIKKNIAKALAFQEETMIINGDTETTIASNINGVYNGTTNPGGIDSTHNDRLLEFDGLRKKNQEAVSAGTIVNIDAEGLAMSNDHIIEAIAGLDKLGLNPDDLILYVTPAVGARMMGWDIVDTMNKLGPNATVIKGKLGEIYGISIVKSSAIPTNLNETGIFDNLTADKTLALLVNKSVCLVGTPAMAERKFVVKYKDEPEADMFKLIPQEDLGFQMMYDFGVIAIVNIAK